MALRPPPSSVKGAFILIPAGKEDADKVLAAYIRHPVPDMVVDTVHIIYSPARETLFAANIEQLQGRADDPFFAPQWLSEDKLIQRASVMEYLNDQVEAYKDPEFPDVGLLPMWHGTAAGNVDSICRTGFANLAITDQGYFGKGLYTAYEAIYAYDAYAKADGVLLLCWVSFFSAFPVIEGDMQKLLGKGHYGSHDAHFIPVAPEVPGNVRAQTVFLPPV
eukprot:m51a1_g11982 hypothetical protein (220) ;mRNA; f:864959-865951